MKKLIPITAMALVSSLALAGCGTTQASTSTTESGASGITVTDARGEKIELDGPAERVIGTEWNVVEHLVSVDVMPVGVADVAGYSTWATEEPLDDSVTDIGVRGEPSVEAIAALRPDLIIGTTDLTEAVIAQLEEVAPVLVVRSADASAQLDQMYANLDLIAQATGTEEQAAEVRADFEEAILDGAAQLKAAGLDGAPVAFADAWVASNQVSIRPFVSGSLIASVNEELGLTTAWKLEGDESYGLATTDVEGLTALADDTTFVYIGNDSDGDDAFAEVLKGNAVWESLPFVEADKVHRLPDGIWMFGGPSSMEAYVDALVEAIA